MHRLTSLARPLIAFLLLSSCAGAETFRDFGLSAEIPANWTRQKSPYTWKIPGPGNQSVAIGQANNGTAVQWLAAIKSIMADVGFQFESVKDCNVAGKPAQCVQFHSGKGEHEAFLFIYLVTVGGAQNSSLVTFSCEQDSPLDPKFQTQIEAFLTSVGRQ